MGNLDTMGNSSAIVPKLNQLVTVILIQKLKSWLLVTLVTIQKKMAKGRFELPTLGL